MNASARPLSAPRALPPAEPGARPDAAVPIRWASAEACVFDCSTCGAKDGPPDRLPCSACAAPDYLAWRPAGESLAPVESRRVRLGRIAALPVSAVGVVVLGVASIVTGIASWTARGGAADPWAGSEPGRIGERP